MTKKIKEAPTEEQGNSVPKKITTKVVALELPFRDKLLAYLGSRPTEEAGHFYFAIKQAGELDLIQNGERED